jgi:hypothetical protein
MYILFALIAATVIGVVIHFALPRRELRGVALAPAVAAASASAVYTGLTWAGLGEGNAWQWLATIAGGAVVAFVTTVLVTRARAAADAATLREAGIA